MDCFAALAMTARAMDCFAEPAIGRAFARPASRREAANACLELHVIASAAKQSILSLRGKMDCFASLALTAGAMDCFAEPVIRYAFARPVGGR